MQTLVELLEVYGLAFVLLNVLADQSGLPLPSYPTLIVASALSPRAGYGTTQILAVAILAALLADAGWYVAGSRRGRSVLRIMCRATQMPDSCVRRTESTFLRFGLLSLLVVKFVPGFSALAAAIAGSTRVRPSRFLAFDIVGAALWASVAIVVGAVFRDSVYAVLLTLERLGRLGLFAVLGAFALYVLYRAFRRWWFLRELRMARVTVAELNAMRSRGDELVIVDARPLSVQDREGRIPGAIRFDPAATAPGPRSFPPDREVVVYCDCPNETSAAIVAKRLLEQGARKVRPLQGGIGAWDAAGYSLER
jgi:membrane protein DedA with SNARE-associated domain/rhodanese-related sulfurtransferase